MKKQKKVQTIHAEPIEVSTITAIESKAYDLISRYGNKILYGFVCLALLAVVLFFVTRKSQSAQVVDYLKVETVYQKFSGAPKEEAMPLFKELQSSLKRHPELKQKYNGLIAQSLLNKQEVALALPYADAAIAQTKNPSIPLFEAFSETSLLISEGNYEKALSQAKSLQKTIHAESVEGPLFAHNLLRLATLEGHVGNKKKELFLWQEMLTLNNDIKGQNPVKEMFGKLNEKGIKIEEFAKNRIAELKT